jgi:hypothetical protein
MRRHDRNPAAALQDSFAVKHHGFDSTPDRAWQAFASRVSTDMAQFIADAGYHLPLLEILKRIGSARADFALEHGHEGKSGQPEFGVLRSDVYELSIKQAAALSPGLLKANQALAKQAGDQPAVQLSQTSATSITLNNNPLFEPLARNLDASMASGEGVQVSMELPPAVNLLVNAHVRKKVKLSPDNFFTKATYRRLAFLAGEEDPTVLTTFYLVNGMEAMFVLMELPPPRVVEARLDGPLDALMRDVLAHRGSDHFLPGVARLIWQCHQLMPFARGSAACMAIFTGALLLDGGIVPRPYPGVRLDIDSLSLAEALFTQRFLDAYQ